MTQELIILKHLQEHKGITSWEAIKEYGITRLSAKIYNLRRRYKIGDSWEYSINRYGDEVRFKRYVYLGLKKI